MAVSKMKKLSAFVSRGDLNAVIAELMELRCVEVAEVRRRTFRMRTAAKRGWSKKARPSERSRRSARRLRSRINMPKT